MKAFIETRVFQGYAQAQSTAAPPHGIRPWLGAAAVILLVLTNPTQAGQLTASMEEVPQGTNINLTQLGSLDWVHWGLRSETSINRKAGVLAQISDFEPLAAATGYTWIYQYADNYNGYSWFDGDPEMTVDNTPTGVWAYGTPLIGSGFRLSVPADTQLKTLKVFVGVFAGRGHFQAYLSDASAPNYSNSGVVNMRNGPGGVYTIEYAANSPKQTLTIDYVLATPMAADGNVTLQAATLSSADGNNPPIVTLTNPFDSSNLPAGSDITLRASANDPDGSIQMVEFFNGETKLGEDDAAPYELTWNNVPQGAYVLTASAIDNQEAQSVSAPVEFFAFGTGGSLTGSTSPPPATVNLTLEGVTDWVHWGLSPLSLVNRKAGITPQIRPLTVIGTNELLTYQDNFTSFEWTDGTPTVSTSGLPQGVFVFGRGNGFEIRAPADAKPRQLKLYVGLFSATSRLQAFLSDTSAPAYTDQSLSNAFGNSYIVYTFDYASATAGQELIVRYLSHRNFDHDFGNVTLQAATLTGGPGPSPVTLLDPHLADGAFLFSFASLADQSYQIQSSPTLDQGGWVSNKTITGTGGLITITNLPDGIPKGFYRVLSN